MSGFELPLLAAAVVASGASAAMQASSASAQASLQAQQARMRQEQAATELELAQIRQRDEEAQRRAAADQNRAQAQVQGVAAGYDPFAAPSFQTLDAFSERQALADISNIRLLGGTRRQRLMMEGRGAEMAAEYFTSQAANAWIAPTVGFLGSAARMGMSYAGGFGGGGGKPAGVSFDAYNNGMTDFSR